MTDDRHIALATDVAHSAHAGQLDKLGQPYVGHCLRVADKVDSAEAKVVAILHDVLEDTTVSREEIRQDFGGRVAQAVTALSRKDDSGNKRPDAEYYAAVAANPLALRVKLADLHDNLDPARLGQLDAATRRRLMRKYGHALIALADATDAPETGDR